MLTFYMDKASELATAVEALRTQLAEKERALAEREPGCHDYRGTAISCEEYEQMQRSKMEALRTQLHAAQEALKTAVRDREQQLAQMARDTGTNELIRFAGIITGEEP